METLRTQMIVISDVEGASCVLSNLTLYSQLRSQSIPVSDRDPNLSFLLTLTSHHVQHLQHSSLN